MISTGKLNELIKELAPTQYNSIIIDNAAAVKEYRYCYIQASTQRIEYRSDNISVAIDGSLDQQLKECLAQPSGNEELYIPVRKGLIALLKESPKAQSGTFLSNAKLRFSELINGGRSVDNKRIRLLTENGRLAKSQPDFIVKEECTISDCPKCNGTKSVSRTDKEGAETQVECPDCKGRGRIASVTCFSPIVKEKEVSLVQCLEGGIEGLKTSTLEAHKGEVKLVRMLTRINGEESEQYPDELRPYLEMLHDKTSEENAIEDIYYRIIPCHLFVYRNVLTGELHNGAVIEPEGAAELVLNLDYKGSKVTNSIKDRIKNINRFFGNIGKTDSFKDKEDLRRTIRLLIAIAVADGSVNDEEKQSLTLSIRNIQQFTNREQEQLLSLLGMTDDSFLTDDDFKFHSRENAETAIARMQEIASSDGMVDERERDIIERLKFKY